jgi:hypothetical protein
MNCGEEIRVKDFSGSYAVRFVAQCGGRFMVVSQPRHDHLNGYLLTDWKAVLRELIALAVPRKLVERTLTAESTADGKYHNIPLTYPLSTTGLSDLLSAPIGQVRQQLADLLVEAD